MMDNTDRFMDQAITNRPHHGLLVFLLIAIPILLSAQKEWQWGNSFGGTFGADEVGDMAVDDSGNVYLIGVTGAGLSLEDSLYQPIGEQDNILISYDCSGQLRWFKILGSESVESANIEITIIGQSLVVYFSKGFNGDPKRYHHIEDTLLAPPVGVYPILFSYSLDGVFNWVRVLGEPGLSKAMTHGPLCSKSDTALFLVKSESSSEIIPGTTVPKGLNVVAFDEGGNYLYSVKISDNYRINTGQFINIEGFATDHAGNYIIAGFGIDSFQIANQPRPAGAFVAKFSPQGQLQWLEGSTGSAWTRIFDLAVRDGMIVCSGDGIRGDTIFGTVLPDPQYLGSVALVTAMSVTGTNFKILFPTSVTSSCIASHCDMKTDGVLAAHLDLGGKTVIGQETFDMPGSSKPVVLLLDSTLNITEHIITNTQGLDYNTSGPIRLLDSNIFISGTFASTIYLGTTDTLYKQGGGDEDIFIAKYGVEQCVDTSTGMQTPTLPTGAFGLLAYPNPATTHLTVKWHSETPGNHSLLLTDMQGRPVHRQVVSGQSGTFRLSTASVSTGLYYLHLQGADGRQAGQMVVVQR